MKTKKGTNWSGDTREVLFACSLGSVLSAVTGDLLFVVLSGVGALAGIRLGRVLYRLRNRSH